MFFQKVFPSVILLLHSVLPPQLCGGGSRIFGNFKVGGGRGWALKWGVKISGGGSHNVGRGKNFFSEARDLQNFSPAAG